MVSKAEALAWVRLEEPMIGARIGQDQVGFPFQGVGAVDLHRKVLEVPLDVAPLVVPVLV